MTKELVDNLADIGSLPAGMTLEAQAVIDHVKIGHMPTARSRAKHAIELASHFTKRMRRFLTETEGKA